VSTVYEGNGWDIFRPRDSLVVARQTRSRSQGRAGRKACLRHPDESTHYGLYSTLRAQKVLEELGNKGYRIGLNSGD
jgi:hypothetical protein